MQPPDLGPRIDVGEHSRGVSQSGKLSTFDAIEADPNTPLLVCALKPSLAADPEIRIEENLSRNRDRLAEARGGAYRQRVNEWVESDADTRTGDELDRLVRCTLACNRRWRLALREWAPEPSRAGRMASVLDELIASPRSLLAR